MVKNAGSHFLLSRLPEWQPFPAVLKGKVHGWLVQKKEVLAFVQARPLEGGAGAVVVLLAAQDRDRG